MKLNPPTESELFYPWLKQESERNWENIKINDNIHGFQIQAGTKWRPGLSIKEIEEFEKSIGLQFSKNLKLFYQCMNGVDKHGINIYANSGEKNKFRPIFHSFPQDIEIINDYINWIYDEFQINKNECLKNEISRIFPVYSHRFILTDIEEEYILSMYGKDVILYAPTLKHLLMQEIFNVVYEDGSEYDEKIIYKKIKFWLD
ncbi:hypothetical protein ACO2KH_18750 [Leptospira terpstrae]|uniref:hypothetical protein n=1 Tax=Leptospira terpstrae TaxID=293075 RepID=UPI003D03DC57